LLDPERVGAVPHGRVRLACWLTTTWVVTWPIKSEWWAVRLVLLFNQAGLLVAVR